MHALAILSQVAMPHIFFKNIIYRNLLSNSFLVIWKGIIGCIRLFFLNFSCSFPFVYLVFFRALVQQPLAKMNTICRPFRTSNISLNEETKSRVFSFPIPFNVSKLRVCEAIIKVIFSTLRPNAFFLRSRQNASLQILSILSDIFFASLPFVTALFAGGFYQFLPFPFPLPSL